MKRCFPDFWFVFWRNVRNAYLKFVYRPIVLSMCQKLSIFLSSFVISDQNGHGRKLPRKFGHFSSAKENDPTLFYKFQPYCIKSIYILNLRLIR